MPCCHEDVLRYLLCAAAAFSQRQIRRAVPWEALELVDKQTLVPAEGKMWLEIARSRLPVSCRRLVQAINFEGISIVEYARRKGVSQPAVSQRLNTIQKN